MLIYNNTEEDRIMASSIASTLLELLAEKDVYIIDKIEYATKIGIITGNERLFLFEWIYQSWKITGEVKCLV